MKLVNGLIAIKSTSTSSDGKTASGLYVVKSDTASVVKEGVVTVVGSPEMSPWSGEWLPTYVKEGDKVLFNGNYFTEVTVNNETLYIGKESQLIAILD